MQIDPKFKQHITTQSYAGKVSIEGVVLKKIPHFAADDGTFLEVTRMQQNGTVQDFPDFTPRQVSYSVMIPGAIKAFHLHYKQHDLWFIHPSTHLLVGLYDVREGSKTFEVSTRLSLGLGQAYLLLIPPGVAHGAANITNKEQTLLYFTDQCFDPDNPDEHRLPHNIISDDFWEIQPG